MLKYLHYTLHLKIIFVINNLFYLCFEQSESYDNRSTLKVSITYLKFLKGRL